MKSAVSTYAFINAKLRGRISKLLPESFFRGIARARTFQEAVETLGPTAYASALEVYNHSGDIKLLELELLRSERDSLARLDRYIPGAIRAFTDAVLTQYDVAMMKHALRLWFERVVRGRPIDDKVAYMLRDDSAVSPVTDAVINATSADDVLSRLADTPYANVIRDVLPEAVGEGSLFMTEVALDTWYFRRLREAAQLLSARDERVALRLIGLQIDVQNVNWLVRMKHYHRLDSRRLAASLLPGGALISIDELTAAGRTDRPLDALVAALGPRYSGLLQRSTQASGDETADAQRSSDHVARLRILEEILRSVLFHEVHRALGSYPFTIGTMLAYFLLVQHEVRTLAGVINAKFYQLDPERIEALL